VYRWLVLSGASCQYENLKELSLSIHKVPPELGRIWQWRLRWA
jgi:hypothetical protein